MFNFGRNATVSAFKSIEESNMEVVTKRSKDTVICPIVYGSMAFYLGKNKSQDMNTHRWSLFIRGPNDEDLSIFVSKVAFSLHESFAEPVRVIEKAPFEVSELGWGEFAAKIRIFFKDPEEQPIDVAHVIKLYPPGGSAAGLLSLLFHWCIISRAKDDEYTNNSVSSASLCSYTFLISLLRHITSSPLFTHTLAYLL